MVLEPRPFFAAFKLWWSANDRNVLKSVSTFAISPAKFFLDKTMKHVKLVWVCQFNLGLFKGTVVPCRE